MKSSSCRERCGCERARLSARTQLRYNLCTYAANFILVFLRSCALHIIYTYIRLYENHAWNILLLKLLFVKFLLKKKLFFLSTIAFSLGRHLLWKKKSRQIEPLFFCFWRTTAAIATFPPLYSSPAGYSFITKVCSFFLFFYCWRFVVALTSPYSRSSTICGDADDTGKWRPCCNIHTDRAQWNGIGFGSTKTPCYRLLLICPVVHWFCHSANAAVLHNGRNGLQK